MTNYSKAKQYLTLTEHLPSGGHSPVNLTHINSIILSSLMRQELKRALRFSELPMSPHLRRGLTPHLGHVPGTQPDSQGALRVPIRGAPAPCISEIRWVFNITHLPHFPPCDAPRPTSPGVFLTAASLHRSVPHFLANRTMRTTLLTV